MTRVAENRMQAQPAAVLVLNTKEAQVLLNLFFDERGWGASPRSSRGVCRALTTQAPGLGLYRSRHGG